MTPLDQEFPRRRLLPRTVLLLSAGLAAFTAGMLAVVPYLAGVLPPAWQALTGACLVMCLCVPLLGYTLGRQRRHECSAAERIVEHAVEGILTISTRGQILFLNPA